MDKKKLKLISNLVFAISSIFAIVTLVIVGRDYIMLMGQGVCVINKNNHLIYAALGLLLLSMLITSFLDAKIKKMPSETENNIFDKTLENAQKNQEAEE